MLEISTSKLQTFLHIVLIYSYASMYNLMMVTTKAETCSCSYFHHIANKFNPLNAEINPICHLLALLGGATIVVVSRLRVKVD